MGIVARAKVAGGVALAVQKRVGSLGGGILAAAVTLALFLSLFPMLLVALAVLGFLSANDQHLATELVSDLGLQGDAATFLTDAVSAAEESRRTASLIGFGGLLWTAIGVVTSVEYVCDRAWGVPSRGFKGRLVAFGWLGGALVLLGGSVALSSLLAVLPWWLAPIQVLGGLALLVGFFLFTFRTLTAKSLPLRVHLPGAIFGGIGFHLLTIAAALIVPRQAASSTALYGSIGVVFAILAWLLLFGRLLVYAVVLNVVLAERRAAGVLVAPSPAPMPMTP